MCAHYSDEFCTVWVQTDTVSHSQVLIAAVLFQIFLTAEEKRTRSGFSRNRNVGLLRGVFDVTRRKIPRSTHTHTHTHTHARTHAHTHTHVLVVHLNPHYQLGLW